jgi:hypothetical protein
MLSTLGASLTGNSQPMQLGAFDGACFLASLEKGITAFGFGVL